MGKWSTRLVLFTAMLLLCAGVSAQKQQEPAGEYVPGQILVKFSQTGPGVVRDDVLRGAAGARIHKFETLGIDLVDLPPGMSMRAALQSYRSKRGVDLVEPNYVRHAIQTAAPPTDPSWLDGSLWGLLKIRVQPVWMNFTPGDGSVIVATLDTGINYTHPDLAPNVWRNPGEIPGNGIDDDNDGYVDDVYGINTVAHTSDPKDDSGHGTHVAGTIAAVGNNALGVVGVSWNTKVLACKFLDQAGDGSDAGAIECLNYVVMLKNRGENIRVTSNSWGASRGSDAPSSLLQAAIDAAGDAGIINIFGAGNGDTRRVDEQAIKDKHGRGENEGKGDKDGKHDGKDNGKDDGKGNGKTQGKAEVKNEGKNDSKNDGKNDGKHGRDDEDDDRDGRTFDRSSLNAGGTDNDFAPFDPASFGSASIVSVASSDRNDGRSEFSNYGLKSVDLAAPGENILSTWLGAGYHAMSGTSVATPHVAGVAALLAQMNPDLSVAEIKAILLATVDKLPAWTGMVKSGGRLSANRAAHAVSPASNARPTVAIVSPQEGAKAPAAGTVTVEAMANDADGTIRHVVFYVNGQYAGKVTASPYKITLTELPLGDYTLTAVAVDNLYGVATSPEVHITVGSNQPPVVTLAHLLTGTSIKSPADLTLDASANDPDGTVTQVSFFSNGALVGTATGPFSVAWNGVKAGTYHVTAVATDNEGATATSAEMLVTIAANQPPTVSLTGLANNASFKASASVLIGANAADADGSVAQVAFFANGSLIGTSSTSPFGVAWKGMAAGSYQLTAVATDDNGATATSSSLHVTIVANAPPTVSVSLPAAGPFKAPANVTINASASDTDGTVTQVAFYQNGSLIATDTTAPYSITWNGATAGSYTLTAVATDDDGGTTTSAGVPITVATNKPPTVALSLPAAGPFKAPANITIDASASDDDGHVTQVAFYQNGTLISTDTTSPFSVAWSGAAAGSYTLTAIATDDDGATTTSAALPVTVAANKPPTVSISLPVAGPFKAPANITIDAGASDDDGHVTQVAFYQNGTLISTDTTSPFSVVWNAAAAGSYTLTAVATDDDGAITTSTALPITVASNKPPSVSLSLSTIGLVKAPASVTLDANASDVDGHVTQVAFYQDGMLVATDTTSPYGTSLSGLGPGAYHMTAVATDDDGATTASNDIVLTVVDNQAPTVSITAPLNGAILTAPASAMITANASDNDGTVTQVAFYVDGVLLGTDSTAPYSFAWSGVGVGSYKLSAIATDDNGATAPSPTITVTVNAPPRINQALAVNGSVALASSTFGAGYPAAAVINGDRKGLNWGSGGGWCDGTQNVWPDWVEVDFNGLKTIDEINVFSMQDSMNSPVEPTKTMTFGFFGLKNFQVQYWDGSIWVTVQGGAIANNNLVWRQVLLAAPVTTTKIRVLVTGSLGNYSRVMELEAWGVSANVPAPAPAPEPQK